MRRAVMFLILVLALSGHSVAEGEDKMDRTIELETIVAGTLDEAWQAWTTTEGITSFFAPQADVKLEIGGRYELYFAPSGPPGSKGSEDCKVLSYLPKEMLSFSWNAPPSIPNLRNAGVKTWVVIRFEAVEEKRVKVKLTHLGIGEGEDWDNYLAYFQNAWPRVLENCRKRFENGLLEWDDN